MIDATLESPPSDLTEAGAKIDAARATLQSAHGLRPWPADDIVHDALHERLVQRLA